MAPTNSAFGFNTVQELSRAHLLTIPNLYLRSEADCYSITLSNMTSMPTIPVIDMERLLAAEATLRELENLNSSCREWGVFQLVNYGVNKMVVEKLKHEIEEFYKLPFEEKMKYQRREGEVEGYGQAILKQKEDEKVEWADRFYMTVNPLHRRKDHLFPHLPSTLREALEGYILALQGLSKTLLGFIAKALKIEEKEMEIFEDGMQSVRMTYYPPCPEPEKVIGFAPHSDACGITILLEVNGVGGLQVKKDGVWIPVKFLPDALVVNLGDCLEILSNGLYKSVEHRVTVNSVKERLSMAMFFNPKFEAEIGPATSALNAQNPPFFKTVTAADYFRSFFARKLNGKTNIDSMKLENGDVYKETV